MKIFTALNIAVSKRQVVALALALSSGLMGCKPSADDAGARAELESASQTTRYYEVAWPSEKGAPSVRYRIPVEYMVKGSVYGTRERIDSFMVCFEMPGATPCPALPKISDPAKRQAFYAVARERYRVVQVTREVGGYDKRARIRAVIKQSVDGLYGVGPYGSGLFRNYDVSGLEQYSHGTCYSPTEMQTAEVRRILAERRDANQALPNCNLSTLGDYVSPPSVIEDDDGGYTYCMSTSCRFYFSIQGREANYEFSSRGRGLVRHGLEHWRSVIDPARTVIKQWIVRNEA